MSAADAFFDTSVLLYLLSGNADKADRVEHLLASGGTISVQILNEFASVATRKLAMPLGELRDVLGTFQSVCQVESLTIETHERALTLMERYRYAVFDSVMIATALLAGCTRLYSEDLQHGQRIERQLRIINPFAAD